MRHIICVIIIACSAAVLMEYPEWELRWELEESWAEYHRHVGKMERLGTDWQP